MRAARLGVCLALRKRFEFMISVNGKRAEEMREKASDATVKLEALRAVAKAFYDRGGWVQYDQLSMDRVWRVTPRRQKFAQPEEATAQHTLFLDCSSFVFAVFYQAFGYCLGADLTKDMMNLERIRRFHYVVSGGESERDKTRVLAEFKQCLQPGDVVVYVYEGNGHTLLYAGEGILYHCSTNGAPSSYDYEARHDNIYPGGALNRVDSGILFAPLDTDMHGRNYLFNPKNTAFCILRPLDEVESVSAQTLRRMKGLNDLRVELDCSHPEGRTATVGEEIIYTLKLENLAEQSQTADLRCDGHRLKVEIQPHGAEALIFKVMAAEPSKQGETMAPPEVKVNGVLVPAPRVLLAGAGCCDGNLAFDPEKALDAIFEPLSAEEGAVYRQRGVIEPNPGLVPGFFGGMGVITPEIEQDPGIRIHKMSFSALQAGDQIVYREAFQSPAMSAVYLGDGLLEGLDREKSARFIDALFGCFCFAVLRGLINLDLAFNFGNI